MRPSSLGGGRILRRTLSVRPVIVAIGNVFSSTASVTDVLFGTHWGPHIVRPSRPHRFLLSVLNTNSINNEQSLWVVSWGVSLQPPSTLVQLLLAGSDFCPGGRTPNPPGKSSTALQGFFQTYIAGTGNKFHPPPEILTPGNVCWCKFLNVVPRALADTAVFFS